MYLTRFRVNPQRREARKLLGSPQAMHAAVLSSYMDAPAPTPESRVLWRVDHRGPNVTLYISGPERPDPTALKEHAGWPELPGGWDTVEYQPFLDKLDDGQTWAFRLTANPVRFGRTTHHEKTVALGHVTVAQQTGWLLDRAEKHGMAIDPATVAVQASRTWQFTRQGKPVTLKVATFDGVLSITEPTAFRRMLCAGIGRARGYGCGLMTLARVTP
ncbi:CRISPR-associated protein, Cse3 family [Stackebrandtia albiflava]|uniref:CRISPR-associated protein, Cse3 family n=1 Tax=Stackebrandtia albiflava TaxID=406432 RepID=A0A562URB2_9ACTN|nr:type I-E CRISPR-associated protein Cas6/Cse3/CasE [Stackebrandtia albiflava]TWJ08144.1 CRISPR-associated protein, Cse3 family [Stackebrandtia albiflava]